MPGMSVLSIENARLIFKNFEGKEGRFNPKGRRNFCVLLDPEQADQLHDDGWNVRWLEPRDPEDAKQAYMQVTVSYDHVPPKIVALTKSGKTVLEEDAIRILDWAEMENADITIRPYEWEVNGRTGVKAYLKTAYITLVEDEFASRYRDVPDASSSSVLGDATSR